MATSAMYKSPSHYSLPAILGIGYNYILLANFVLAIIWLFTKHKLYTIIFFIGLFLTLPATRNSFSLASAEHSEQNNKSIKIMTYNTLCLGKELDKDQYKILNFIKSQDADIVCLQEIKTSQNKGQYYLTLEQVKETLGYEYSYVDYKLYNGEHKYGMAVFSRFPLINKQTIRYESHFNQSDRCDVIIDTDTFRLINNHLESNQFTKRELTIPHIQSEEIKESANHITRKLTTAYQVRALQAQKISQEIKQSPYPVIVCGDFNDVPVSYTYRTIKGKLRDSMLEACPRHLCPTLSVHNIGIRIDYILHSNTMVATNHQVIDAPYSDHKPVMATLEWK